MKSGRGLTLIETLVALLVLAIALSALSFLLISSVSQNRDSGIRTQAVQLLNYFGRRVVGAENALLPPDGASKSWSYGTLSQSFPDLAKDPKINTDIFKVRIENLGTPSWKPQGADLAQYRIRVCWKRKGTEACVLAETISSEPTASSAEPPLPGVN